MPNLVTETFVGLRSGGETIPLDIKGPFIIPFIRGSAPGVIECIVRDLGPNGATKFDNLKNPIDIVVRAPNEYHNATTEQVFRGWYLTGHWPTEVPGERRLEIKDVRWLAEYRKFTGAFNIYQDAGDNTTGRPLADTFPGGNTNTPWQCVDALLFVLNAFGLQAYVGGPMDFKVARAVLPRNLGPSLGGGWVGADFAEVVDLITTLGYIDIVPDYLGRLVITDRISENTEKLDNFVLNVGGDVNNRQIKQWVKPKNLRLLFEQRVEDVLEFTEHEVTSSPRGIELENVIQHISGTDDFKHVNLEREAMRIAGYTLRDIRQNWAQRRVVFIDEDSMQPGDIEDRELLDSYLRGSFRQTFRLHNTSQNVFADVNFGHLAVDGTTETDKSVYMDYTVTVRWTDLRNVPRQQLLDTTYSREYPFTLNKAAPFRVFSYVNQAGDQIVQIEPSADPRWRDFMPGLLSRPISYGSRLSIASGSEVLPTYEASELLPRFTLRIYYHGLLRSRWIQGGFTQREHAVTVPLGGEGPDVFELFIPSITANWGFERPLTPPPRRHVLLNERDIREIADQYADIYDEYFENNLAGTAYTKGVEAQKAGAVVRGNIYSMYVDVGAKGPGSVRTVWNIFSNVTPRFSQAERDSFNGPPIRRVR